MMDNFFTGVIVGTINHSGEYTGEDEKQSKERDVL